MIPKKIWMIWCDFTNQKDGEMNDSLEFYKNNPDKYVKKCREIKEYSTKYCWTNHIKEWANFIY